MVADLSVLPQVEALAAELPPGFREVLGPSCEFPRPSCMLPAPREQAGAARAVCSCTCGTADGVVWFGFGLLRPGWCAGALLCGWRQ